MPTPACSVRGAITTRRAGVRYATAEDFPMTEPKVRSERLDLRGHVRCSKRWTPRVFRRWRRWDPVVVRLARVARAKLVGGAPAQLERVEDLSVPGPGGEIPVRLYAGPGEDSCAALIYFHGGGFVLGDLEMPDTYGLPRVERQNPERSVFSVGLPAGSRAASFRRRWKTPTRATLWITRNAARLGVDPQRIAVGGDSAGANLATVVAMRCRTAGRAAADGAGSCSTLSPTWLLWTRSRTSTSRKDMGLRVRRWVGFVIITSCLPNTRTILRASPVAGGRSGGTSSCAGDYGRVSIRCVTRARPTRNASAAGPRRGHVRTIPGAHPRLRHVARLRSRPGTGRFRHAAEFLRAMQAA